MTLIVIWLIGSFIVYDFMWLVEKFYDLGAKTTQYRICMIISFIMKSLFDIGLYLAFTEEFYPNTK